MDQRNDHDVLEKNNIPKQYPFKISKLKIDSLKNPLHDVNSKNLSQNTHLSQRPNSNRAF